MSLSAYKYFTHIFRNLNAAVENDHFYLDYLLNQIGWLSKTIIIHQRVCQRASVIILVLVNVAMGQRGQRAASYAGCITQPSTTILEPQRIPSVLGV